MGNGPCSPGRIGYSGPHEERRYLAFPRVAFSVHCHTSATCGFYVCGQCGEELLGEPPLAAEEVRDAGQIEEEAFGGLALFQSHRGTEAEATAGQFEEGLAVGGAVASLDSHRGESG